MDVLTIQNLSKSFGGQKVIDGLSFTVPQGAVFGFLGQNGAGKTTTMKMILGLLKADGGEITVCGDKVTFGQTKTNDYIGYLQDVPEFYGYMRSKEYLRLCGEITGMPNHIITSRCEELLSLVGLDSDKKISGFSRGMKQRLGIAQALFNEPKLLICDEPTSALDPVGRKEILDILQQVRGKTTVIFSTHILSDVERICDWMAVLHKGKLALAGTLEQLRARHKVNTLTIEFASASDKEHFTALEQMLPFLNGAEQNGISLTLHAGDIAETQTATLSALAEHRLNPVKIEVGEPTIENLFLEVVR